MGHPVINYNDILLNMLIRFGALTWFVIVSLLVLLRLDKIIKLLEKK
jgi:hypothetical protein